MFCFEVLRLFRYKFAPKKYRVFMSIEIKKKEFADCQVVEFKDVSQKNTSAPCLPGDTLNIIFLKLNAKKDYRMFSLVNKDFYQSTLNPVLWRPLLQRHFPYSYIESQSGLSERPLFHHLRRIKANIKNRSYLDKLMKVGDAYSEQEIDRLRVQNALHIHEGVLFHVGFGSSDFLRFEGTTVDMHRFKVEFNMESADSSFRMDTSDVISAYVQGEHFYWGTKTGEVLIWRHKDAKLLKTVRCGSGYINAILASSNYLFYSDCKNYCLVLYDFKTLPPKTLLLGSPVVYLQMHKEHPYCVTLDGKIAIIDVASAQLVKMISIDHKIVGKPLIKGDCLYAPCSDKKLVVWDLEKNIMKYFIALQSEPNAVIAHGEYIFIGLKSGNIESFDRDCGRYVQCVYHSHSNISSIASLCIYGDSLYAYTSNGEIIHIAFDRHASSEASQFLTREFRPAVAMFESLLPAFLTGPNRINK